jgi:hypothetical protein
VATLSTPIVKSTIESSRIVLPPGKIGDPNTINRVDSTRDITPLPICKARNHAGGLLPVIIDDMDSIIS